MAVFHDHQMEKADSGATTFPRHNDQLLLDQVQTKIQIQDRKEMVTFKVRHLYMNMLGCASSFLTFGKSSKVTTTAILNHQST